LPVEGIGLDVIQAPKPRRIMRYELTDFESAAIRPFLPNKPRGISRNLIERVLQQDQATSASSRPDTTSSRANYLAFIKRASFRIWLRANKSTPQPSASA
jgi:hypothetical protein